MVVHVLGSVYRRPVRYVVRIGTEEKEDSGLYSLLQQFHVSKRRNHATQASFKLDSQLDEDEAWSVLQEACAIGDPIVVEADFGQKRERIMRGRICGISRDTPEPGNRFAVNLECQDESIRLQKRREHKIWSPDRSVSDQFIVSTVLTKYGLDLDPTSAQGSQCSALEQNATDYDFLRQRAEVNRYELLFEHDQVYFGPMRFDARPQKSIQVIGAQANCARFSVRRHDQAPPGFGFIRAEGELDGGHYGHVLHVGKPVEVNALDECYGGMYYVDTVKHSFTRTSYRQEFNLLRQFDTDNCVGDFSVNTITLPGSLYQLL
ncbi:MAG: hypothetical protein H6970_02270 [Gammaproteobacteria bacterium]|nr:hypothetical protein [Gammaproteobacteria bacterium]MCP5423883.1 hypothetical protein [Gammaproteobacteria bacterium]